MASLYSSQGLEKEFFVMRKDKYDRMTPDEFHRRLVEAVGGVERAKMVIEKELLVVDKRLFTPAHEQIVLPRVDRFSVAESFQLGTHDGLRIAYIGERFNRLFSPVIEQHVPQNIVRRLVLRKRTSTIRLVPDLGKRPFACLPLAHIYAFMKLVAKGQQDYLYFGASIQKRTMWPIMVDWSADGWCIESPEHIRGTKTFNKGRVIVAKYRERE